MELFERRGGVADGAGERFEIKVIALLFVRGIRRRHSFRIASNMEDCGAFDDVIFQYEQHTSFLQLKHKKSSSLPLKFFHMSGNDFDLFKYLQSYHTILQRFSSSTNHPVFGADLDQCSFFLYTNAVFQDNRHLQHGKFLHDDIHNSGGENGFVFGFSPDNQEDEFAISLFEDLQKCQRSVRSICERNGDNKVLEDSLLLEIEELIKSATRSEIKDLLKSVRTNRTKQSLDKLSSCLDFVSVCDSFLKNVRIIDGQAGVDDLDNVVKKEISELCDTDQRETNVVFNELIRHIEEWWRRDSQYLTEKTEFWTDMMKSRADRVTLLSSHKLEQMENLNLRFRDSRPLCFSEFPTNVVADKSCTLLSCIKIRQAMEEIGQRKPIFIDIAVLQHREVEVMSLWPTVWCDTLIADCGSRTSEGQDVVQNLAKRSGFVVVSSSAIPGVRSVQFDVCGFAELDDGTKRRLLESTVMFQGYQMQLDLLISGDENVLNAIQADLVLELVKSQVPMFGKCLKKLDFHYVKRCLCDPDKPVESTSSQASFPEYVWSSTERVFLLTADPGMGKSTFLTHIAIQSKDANPTWWIIVINLNEHSVEVEKLSDTDCSVESAVEFLWKVAGEHRGCDFERTLFWHTILGSGRCVVFLDAFDEISPTYTEKILRLTKAISETNVAKMCVAFRPVVRDVLETFLNFKSLTLTALSHEEQVELLYSSWIKCADISHVHAEMETLPEEEVRNIRAIFGGKIPGENFPGKLDSYTRYVLCRKSNKVPDSFWSVPLHVSLLAVVYESHAIVSMNDCQMYAPQKFDMIDLYSAFVEKKLRIYCREKKDEAEELSAVLDDNEILREQFIEKHAMAGVVALLPPNYVRELSNKELESEATKFLRRIEEGKEKRGVVVKIIGGKPYFVHRTFAEYFAAIWFSNNYADNVSILKKLYFSPIFVVFREMFDRILSVKCELHHHILSGTLREFVRVLPDKIDEVDAGGRTALHLAAVHQEQFHIIRAAYPLWTFVSRLLDGGASTTRVDNVFGMSPLQYAENVCNTLSLGDMFRSSDFEPSDSSLAALCQHVHCDCDDNLRETIDASRGLFISVNSANLDVALHLLRSGVDSNLADERGVTILHFAVLKQLFELVRALVNDCDVDVGRHDQENRTAVDLAENSAKFTHRRSERNFNSTLRKCIFYCSEDGYVNLPYRNWGHMKSYYNSERTLSNCKNLSPCYYEFLFWHLVAENLQRCVSRFLFEYLTEVTTTSDAASSTVGTVQTS